MHSWMPAIANGFFLEFEIRDRYLPLQCIYHDSMCICAMWNFSPNNGLKQTGEDFDWIFDAGICKKEVLPQKTGRNQKSAWMGIKTVVETLFNIWVFRLFFLACMCNVCVCVAPSGGPPPPPQLSSDSQYPRIIFHLDIKTKPRDV